MGVIIMKIFQSMRTQSMRAKEKEKQGVQLLGPSGPKASRTSPNFFRFQMSLTSQLGAR